MLGGLTGRPSTVIRSWSGSISMPVGGGRTPFTRTEPEEMSSSAARRLATPDRARNLFNLSRGAERGSLGGSSAPMRPTPPRLGRGGPSRYALLVTPAQPRRGDPGGGVRSLRCSSLRSDLDHLDHRISRRASASAPPRSRSSAPSLGGGR